MSLNVKGNNDLTTQLAQSDRPLSYNKFNDLEKWWLFYYIIILNVTHINFGRLVSLYFI